MRVYVDEKGEPVDQPSEVEAERRGLRSVEVEPVGAGGATASAVLTVKLPLDAAVPDALRDFADKFEAGEYEAFRKLREASGD